MAPACHDVLDGSKLSSTDEVRYPTFEQADSDRTPISHCAACSTVTVSSGTCRDAQGVICLACLLVSPTFVFYSVPVSHSSTGRASLPAGRTAHMCNIFQCCQIPAPMYSTGELPVGDRLHSASCIKPTIFTVASLLRKILVFVGLRSYALSNSLFAHLAYVCVFFGPRATCIFQPSGASSANFPSFSRSTTTKLLGMERTKFNDSSPDQIHVLSEDIGATSAEYENQQHYLQGARLHLITASYVVLSFQARLKL